MLKTWHLSLAILCKYTYIYQLFKRDKMKPLKLITETASKIKFLKEAYDPSKPLTIKFSGPYMVANKRNANSRIYPAETLNPAVEKFVTEMVDTNRALQELEHPEEATISPDRVCARILKLEREGDTWYGESVVLASDDRFGIKGTRCGDLLASLIEYDTQIGVSSRALGEVDEDGTVSDLQIVTCDVVLNPSIGQFVDSKSASRFVNGILESKEFIVNTHGEILEETYDNFERKLKKLPKKQSLKEAQLSKAVHDFFKSLIV